MCEQEITFSHPTWKGTAWKFVKTFHVKFCPLARKWPARRVTDKYYFFRFTGISAICWIYILVYEYGLAFWTLLKQDLSLQLPGSF